MKFAGYAAIAATLVLGTTLYVKYPRRQPSATMAFSKDGFTSLKVNGVELLANGQFKVHQVTLRKPSGETYAGATVGRLSIDPAAARWSETYPWGELSATYRTSGNRLDVTIAALNKSSTDTIQSLWLEPFVLRFPEKLVEYDGSIPLLVNSVGGPAVLRVSNSTASLVVVSDNYSKPLQLGFPWANNKPENTVFPFSVNTGRIKSYPDSYPLVDREVRPGARDEFPVSLRFGHPNATILDLAGESFKKYAETFPQTLQWKDRRPIGSIFLASSGANWQNNPRGWLNSRVDVTTEEGRKDFRQKVLEVADTSIGIMRQMNAQGAITWDIEGQEHQHSISYIGDPRLVDSMAPEMATVASEYFKRFRDAGLRTGVCIRPQEFRKAKDGTLTQVSQQDPAAVAAILIDKIRFAKDRWGVTLFYLDSNVNAHDANPIAPAVLQKVAATFPDILLIPEHSTFQYYAFSAPYKELRQGYTSTAEAVRLAYPRAFTFIATPDGPLDHYKKALVASMKQGDSVIYRTWFPDPQNEKVKALFSP